LPFRFPRAHRLRRRAEFLHVQENGARVSTRHLLVLLTPRSNDDVTRLGVVASKKVGGAVERNRAKRLLREAFRRNAAEWPAHTDIVIIVRPGTHELSQAELDKELCAVAPLVRKRAAGQPADRARAKKPTPKKNADKGDASRGS
jgi:ribonuclease P protein component